MPVEDHRHRHLDDLHLVMMAESNQQQQKKQTEPDGPPTSLQDLYAQLVQKERDLLLAAQLGKALLEKNEELGLQNEKMAEEYSRQLEVSHYRSLLLDVMKAPHTRKPLGAVLRGQLQPQLLLGRINVSCGDLT